MTKEELVRFIKDSYCDIEAQPLPKELGLLPLEERLLKRTQLNNLLSQARNAHGELLVKFLELHMAGGSLPHGKKRVRFFWLDFDNWDLLYTYWQRYQENSNTQAQAR